MAAKLSGQRCLCRGCGEFFSTPGNFDRHRRNGQCLAPDVVGLVLVAGIWKRAEIRTPEALARMYGRDERAQA